MGTTIRFGVSLDDALLDKFDSLCLQQGYKNRSEAVRDLIRNALVQQEWKDLGKEIVGTLTLIYDHHQSDLGQKVTSIQHDALEIIISTLHVHIDECNCMEVLVLRGSGEKIRQTAQRLISTKGIKHGKLNLSTTGKDLV